MELLQLRYFCTVAELESVTAAAKRYLLPQPAMSITVKKLETELGRPLFDRVGNRIRLNDDGRRFYQYARQAIDLLDTAVTTFSDTDEPNGEVRLLVQTNRFDVVRIVSEFQKLHPLVRFYVSHSYAASPEDFDLRVFVLHHPPEETDAISVFHERMVLAVPDEHPLAVRTAVRISELRDECFILLPPGSGSRAVAMELCRKSGFTPQSVVECDDPHCRRKYIAAGLGVAFAPEHPSERLLDEAIRLIPIDDEDAMRTVAVSPGEDGALSPTAAAFRDFLVTKLRTSYVHRVSQRRA